MTDDWTRRAEREAAALIDASGVLAGDRPSLLTLVAAAWLQGAILGGHEFLAGAEVSFEQMQARL
jgi:glutathione S-transferase